MVFFELLLHFVVNFFTTSCIVCNFFFWILSILLLLVKLFHLFLDKNSYLFSCISLFIFLVEFDFFGNFRKLSFSFTLFSKFYCFFTFLDIVFKLLSDFLIINTAIECRFLFAFQDNHYFRCTFCIRQQLIKRGLYRTFGQSGPVSVNHKWFVSPYY